MENIDKSLNELLTQMGNDPIEKKENGNEKNNYVRYLKTYFFHIALFIVIIISVYYTKPMIFYDVITDPNTKKSVRKFLWTKCLTYIIIIYLTIIGLFYIHKYYFCNNKRI